MGYDYEITYKNGKDNLVADSLSHTFDDHASLSAISMPIPTWLHYVQQAYVNDSSLSEIIQQLASNPSVVSHSVAIYWISYFIPFQKKLHLSRSYVLRNPECPADGEAWSS